MKHRLRIVLTVVGLLLLVALSPSVYPLSEGSVKPHFEARERISLYHGPGRDEPAPEGMEEINLGYFGPSDQDDRKGGQIWMAAQMAIERANLEDGYRGLPFRLVPAWADNPWGSGISQLAKSIYSDHLWAIIGSIDGPSTHLVEQLVAKARLPLINPASSDKTVNLANVPWMFSCLPGEHLQAPVLAAAIAEAIRDGSFTIVSGIDHDSRVLTKELKFFLSRLGFAPEFHFQLDSHLNEVGSLAARTLVSRPDVIVILAGADRSALLLEEIRRQGFQGRVFGSPHMAREAFLRTAGASAQGVVFPLLVNGQDTRAFTEEFVARYGREPDFLALQTYDAVLLLVEAIRKAGLNRARIRDAVRALAPWHGFAGPVTWDSLGQNTRPVGLATINGHRVEPLLPPPLPRQ